MCQQCQPRPSQRQEDSEPLVPLVGGGDWFSPPRPLTHRAVTGVVLGPRGIALDGVILIPICLFLDTETRKHNWAHSVLMGVWRAWGRADNGV